MTKFKTGATYFMKSICDSNCKWEYTVARRTEKTIFFTDGSKFRIKECDDSEFCKPLGTYSMSPTLRAKQLINNEGFSPLQYRS